MNAVDRAITSPVPGFVCAWAFGGGKPEPVSEDKVAEPLPSGFLWLHLNLTEQAVLKKMRETLGELSLKG